jgi:uncharacterized lipoprotein NlpE involved in copper resistance
MKKLLIFASTLVITLVGCETKNAVISDTDVEIAGCKFKTYEIEGCEYIGAYIGSNTGILTHKGNCKNCRNLVK